MRSGLQLDVLDLCSSFKQKSAISICVFQAILACFVASERPGVSSPAGARGLFLEDGGVRCLVDTWKVTHSDVDLRRPSLTSVALRELLGQWLHTNGEQMREKNRRTSGGVTMVNILWSTWPNILLSSGGSCVSLSRFNLHSPENFWKRLEVKKVELEVIPSTDNTILLFCRPKETATYFLYYLSLRNFQNNKDI